MTIYVYGINCLCVDAEEDMLIRITITLDNMEKKREINTNIK
jgi:hypothetical protein